MDLMSSFSDPLKIVFAQYGNTALHEAAWKGYSRTVHLLCRKRGNVYIKNRGGFTPLHLSCQNGHNQTCRNILITGCKPDLKNDVS
jgi:ankyrin repeat protein